MIVLSAAVQAHPLRRVRAEELAAEVDGVVAFDPDPLGPRDTWRSHRLAWLAADEDATHHLVVQDDAVPVPRFRELAERAVTAMPHAIVCFFVNAGHAPGRMSVLRARRQAIPFALLPSCFAFVPCVALAAPVDVGLELVRWGDARLGPPPVDDESATAIPSRPRLCDDAAVGAFVCERRVEVWATAPCLCDHDDDAPSITGNARRIDPLRVAILLGAGQDWNPNQEE